MPIPHITTDPVMTAMKAAGRVGVPVLLWSDPGMSKSSTVAAVAESEGLHLETVIASVREPSDFAGLPVITEAGVTLHPPAFALALANLPDDAAGGMLFLDELSTAPPAVQAACLRVVLDRVVGDLNLPSRVRVVAAANPPETAADGWDLSPAMANRFLHIDFRPRLDTWLDGMIAGFRAPTPGRVYDPSPERIAVARAEVAEFIRVRPDLLHSLPTNAAETGRAWPSRRTWTMTADVLALIDREDTEAALLAATGLVGAGAATEFIAWRKTSGLPHPAEVVADPSIVAWDALRPDLAWVILSGVVAHCTAQGTKVAWTAAWSPLAAAAQNGMADVAAANVRALMRARPAKANPPVAARALVEVVTAAGLM